MPVTPRGPAPARGMPEDPIVWQRPNAQHGNLIETTPAIRAIAECLGRPVKVFFSTPTCADLVERAPFIERLPEAPIAMKPLFTTADINQRIPDHRFLYQRFAVPYGHPGPMPHSYVDQVDNPACRLADRFVAVIRGAAGNPSWVPKKDPGDAIYRHVLDALADAGVKAVLIGGPLDRERWCRRMASWHPGNTIDASGDGIRFALGIIHHAEAVVANDTGMYHASGALKKRMLVLWKHTNLEKNRVPPYDGVTYSRMGKWQADFGRWFQSALEPSAVAR